MYQDISFSILEGGIFQCPYCLTNFRFSNSLRAHIRFKCEHRRNLHPVDSIQATVAREMKEKLLASGFMDYRAPLYAGFHPRIPIANRMSTDSLHSGGTLPSPASSSGSTSLPSPGKLSPGSDHKRSRSRSPPCSSPVTRSPVEDRTKRSLDTNDEYNSVKRLVTEESRKPESFSPREGSQSPELISRHHSPPSGVKSEKLRIDMNQNVNNPSDDEENVSAFRKVEKQPCLVSSVSPQSEQQQSFDLTAANPGTALYNPAIRGDTKVILGKNFGMEGALMSRYPILPPGSLPPAFLATSGLSENISVNLAELYRNPVKLTSMGRPMEKVGDINNIENNNIAGKVPAYFGAETRGIGVPMPFGYYKSPNPMVDKLLSTNAPAPTAVLPSFATLATNWCAKCNATFRMTSDLVYHMRSHHKSNCDPMKKKREDKLKCNICGETFRERHHLTRHMTSHA